MLNTRISQAKFDGLSDIEKSHYVKKGDQYVLDVNGDTEEMVALRQQNVTLHQKVLDASNEAEQAKAQVKDAATTAEAKFKSELETAQKSLADMRSTVQSNRQSALIDGIASKFKQPELFRGVLKDQIKVEYNEKGELVETFTNAKGESITLEQLADSYCKAPQYSAMLTTPTSTPTLPTNQPPAGGVPQQQQSQQPLFAPQGGAPAGGQPSWGMDATTGKPVVYNWAAMSDAETSAYAAAKVAANGTT